jgi:hypothetical protein
MNEIAKTPTYAEIMASNLEQKTMTKHKSIPPFLCAECHRPAQLVYVSKDGKSAFFKCKHPHKGKTPVYMVRT